MKLLLDENLSQRLVPALQAAYPDSTQVSLIGLAGAEDGAVRQHAGAHGFTLVTKDDDFVEWASHRGPPPVVIRLTLGNCRNQRVLAVLLEHRERFEQAVARPSTSLLEVG